MNYKNPAEKQQARLKKQRNAEAKQKFQLSLQGLLKDNNLEVRGRPSPQKFTWKNEEALLQLQSEAKPKID